jgi:hypothetical protein
MKISKMTLLRDAGMACIAIAVVLKLFEQPVYGDRYAFSRVAWYATSCGILLLLLWVFLSLAADARRERREKNSQGAPPSSQPPADG